VRGVSRREIGVLPWRSSRVAGERVERVVALGRALSDPIRVRMLGMLAAEAAEGRGCCGLPDLGAPVSGEEDSPGICVCELEECFEMGQSRVSYHMRKLKEAGLVREQRRGRWSFYSLDREAARDLLADTGKHLSA
jgi:ArsR family transcriptional regulator, arsenate/arsenite/antimonite-responsive transcriptional repressor